MTTPSSKARQAWDHIRKHVAPVQRAAGAYTLFYREPTTNALNSITFRGITKWLKAHYWDNYRPSSARAKSKKPTAKQRLVGGSTGTAIVGVGARKKVRCANLQTARIVGLERGKLVHRQLGDYIACGAKERRFRERHPIVHPATRAVIAHLHERGWELVGADLPVYDPSLRANRWATEIDLVALDPNSNCIILIELKTGYDTNFGEATGPMTCSTLQMNNSPLNQAKVQLVASALLFTALYPDISRTVGLRLVVLHVESAGGNVLDCQVTRAQYEKISASLDKTWWRRIAT